MSALTAERLREVMHYDPATGEFLWKKPTSNRVKAGDRPREVNQGYYVLTIDGKTYRAHRLAWLFVYGKWPDQMIDHKNCDRKDNRIENLRDVSRTINQQNRRSACGNSKSGLLGAHWNASANLWHSAISVHGVRHRLGNFKTAEAAHQAYLAAKRRLHEGCTI